MATDVIIRSAAVIQSQIEIHRELRVPTRKLDNNQLTNVVCKKRSCMRPIYNRGTIDAEKGGKRNGNPDPQGKTIIGKAQVGYRRPLRQRKDAQFTVAGVWTDPCGTSRYG